MHDSELSRQCLEDIVQFLGVGVICQEADGRIRLWNRAAEGILGLSAREALGLTSTGHLWRLIHEDGSFCPEEEHPSMMTLTNGRPLSGQLRGVARPGAPVTWLSIDTRPLIRPGQDKPHAVVVSLTDITQRLAAERERDRLAARMHQAEKVEALGTLAGGLAHQFNNIMTVVLGFAELAREDALSGRTDPRDLDQIIAAAVRAKDQVGQMLTFGRGMQTDPRPMDLNKSVARSVASLQRVLPEGVVVETRLAPDLHPINADAVQMGQALSGLAANAADAMPDGGRLVIETANLDFDAGFCRAHNDLIPGPYVLLKVTDTGVGMDEATRRRVFDPFFSTKQVGRGNGLGLSAVHGMVRSHGGHVSCRSAPGQGAVFLLYFPAYHGEDVDDGTGAGGSANAAQGGPGKLRQDQ